MTASENVRIRPVDLEDFFKLEYRAGGIRSQLTGERMQLVPTIWWDKLNDILLHELREDGPPAIHMIGYSLGYSLVAELKASIGDRQALAKHVTDVAAAAGWGVISMAGDLREGKRFTVSVVNCLFCENEPLGQSPRCSFLASVVEGMADRIYGPRHRAWETRCSASGEALCEFNVEKGPLKTNLQYDSLSQTSPEWESLWASAIPAILLAGRNGSA